ncbi:MAG: glycosyltransferase [Thermodesulfobacteriota bacterium]|nr:glycosyltransferase [Thermodesulfobacteriota bacterium]
MKEKSILEKYHKVAGRDVVEHLCQLAKPLKGLRVVHVNSTRIGGGVAEILQKMVPLMQELDIDTKWEVITGDSTFYQCTKSFHNAIHGNRVVIPENHFKIYEEINHQAAEAFRDTLKNADIVFIHDAQPAAIINDFPNHKGKWVWRCHMDASHPFRPVWRYLRDYISLYNASVFSIANFVRRLPRPAYLIAPSIDPLHEKNVELDKTEIDEVCSRFKIDKERLMLLQVSRFDRLKDPIGVIQAYKLVQDFMPNIQLVLAGGGATDDPEGELILNEVREAVKDDPNIKILLLPGDAHRTINALQRASDIVLQKSLREGFGLTVTEAMWKKKPVIGGDTGGIRIQVVNHHTGFLVNSPEGAALRIRYLLNNRHILDEMGKKAMSFVRENFLITRQLREYLTLIFALLHGTQERITLG